MILIYRPNKAIHQYFGGFGTVSISGVGTLLIDGNDTTTCAADVSWKYIEEQVLERDEFWNYKHDADYYAEITPPPKIQDQIDTILELIGV